MHKFFVDIEADNLRRKILIVDIDGTIAYDRGDITSESLEKLKELKKVSEIYLCSNGSIERTKNIAHRAGVNYMDSLHRKPSSKILDNFDSSKNNLVVIGDKALTDGLFAANIGAKFLKVASVRHIDDHFITKFIYFIDKIFGKILLPIFPYLVLIRPKQWIKNVIVLAPIFFAGTILSLKTLTQGLFAVLIFCTVSSAIYVLNDICDLSQDRKHIIKRRRPLASGIISIKEGIVFLMFLLIISISEMYFLPDVSPAMIIYIIVNLLYSFFLKHVAVIDIVCVALFYVLRLVAGGFATHTNISSWIILCVFFASLFLIIGKRRSESLHVKHKKVIDSYASLSLDYMLISAMCLTLINYIMYTIFADKSPFAIYSSVFVVVAVFRLLNLMYNISEEAEYPETLFFKDKIALDDYLGIIYGNFNILLN